MQLLKGSQPHQKSRRIDGNPLYTYFEHELEVFTINSAGRIVCITGVFWELI